MRSCFLFLLGLRKLGFRIVFCHSAAVEWCANASAHAQSYGGKPWRYLLIPHDEIATNITLDALAARFG
jgi:type III restriction enzyme